jgi:hypothetical protein
MTRAGWLLALAILWFWASARRGQMVINVDDYYNNDGTYRCNGFDEIDDADCWQNAINAAKAGPGYPFFGTPEATAKATYIISNTLLLNSAFGGEINGNGALLAWRRPRLPDRPLLLLEDTQQLKIRNLKIASQPA